ncbi:hypothetical protein HYO65_gp144 [Tenacibaculum phage PTm1]|nr:hypothetical protein HYO65_gp144 [Tenacibaculum phage PTm1]BBI90536.1 hypothetical protein [Tenacibaculum phage PTm1]
MLRLDVSYNNVNLGSVVLFDFSKDFDRLESSLKDLLTLSDNEIQELSYINCENTLSIEQGVLTIDDDNTGDINKVTLKDVTTIFINKN